MHRKSHSSGQKGNFLRTKYEKKQIQTETNTKKHQMIITWMEAWLRGGRGGVGWGAGRVAKYRLHGNVDQIPF